MTIISYTRHSTNRGACWVTHWILSLTCSTDSLRKSFAPRATQLYKSTQKMWEIDLCVWVSTVQCTMPLSDHPLYTYRHPNLDWTLLLSCLIYRLLAVCTSISTASTCVPLQRLHLYWQLKTILVFFSIAAYVNFDSIKHCAFLFIFSVSIFYCNCSLFFIVLFLYCVAILHCIRYSF